MVLELTVCFNQSTPPGKEKKSSAAMCVKVKVKVAYIKHKVMALQRQDLGCRLRDRLDDNTGADSSIHRPPVLCQDPDVRRLKVQPEGHVKYFSSYGQQESYILQRPVKWHRKYMTF